MKRLSYKWAKIELITLTTACLVLGGVFLHAQSTRFADAGNKLVINLEPLPKDYWIEFLIGSDPPHLTKTNSCKPSSCSRPSGYSRMKLAFSLNRAAS